MYVTHDAGRYAIHTQTRVEIWIHHRGGKFDTDAEVVLPLHRASETVRPSDYQNQSLQPLEIESDLQCHHEILQVDMIALKEKSLVHKAEASHQ